jgi:RNA polymerase sigma-70 factor, ECF subfamily
MRPTLRGRPAAAPGRRDTEGIADLAGLMDAELTDAIARADEQALGEAYRRHASASRALALRLVRDRALADDVVQEVFVRLWTQAGRFDGSRGTLRAYVLAQTHGRSLDLLRSETARRRREEREARLGSAPVDVEREAIANTVADEVHRALASLPEDERAPVELAYQGGLPYREVGRQLGIPEGTAKSRIRSGLSRLRRALVEGAAADPSG